MASEIEYFVGSDNIFADIGIPNAKEHLLKAKLVSRIYDIVHVRGITQKETGKILGISQPRVSQMLGGHFSQFSVEKLMGFLNALDHDIEIRIKPKPKSAKRPARINIKAA